MTYWVEGVDVAFSERREDGHDKDQSGLRAPRHDLMRLSTASAGTPLRVGAWWPGTTSWRNQRSTAASRSRRARRTSLADAPALPRARRHQPWGVAGWC
ncbi:MAG: hypothetical protein JO166_04925 [Deltaproteobacteria bacterium]|nr:hypothetical protein [Deltaproteobacteria bacterium]